MKTKKPNAELVCKQIEDLLVPSLRLSSTDRAVYSHLLRHSRLEGKPRLRFSMPWLARGNRLPMLALAVVAVGGWTKWLEIRKGPRVIRTSALPSDQLASHVARGCS